MPAIVAELLWKVFLPILVSELEKTGEIDKATEVAAMGVSEFMSFIKGLDISPPDNEKPEVLTNLKDSNGNSVGG